MINVPVALTRALDSFGALVPVWFQWASGITAEVNRDWGIGTTAARPTGAKIKAGDRYFDSTLGLPIWYDGTIWIKADGTAA